jgi:DNA-binding winged helix-turn-helix (wHTH) protein/tetratricopeptide (TPR) repeat protein
LTRPVDSKQEGIVLRPSDGRLLHHGIDVKLPSKAVKLLHALGRNPGRILSKAEIFDVVWQGRHVGDASLKNLVRILRRALGDTAEAPKFIETVRGRGYRLIGEIAFADALSGHDLWHAVPRSEKAGSADSLIVGRSDDLERLHRCLAAAKNGARQFAVVSGELGIGKTTLVSRFLEEISDHPDLLVAKGQASEGAPGRETFAPFLDALEQLTADPAAASHVQDLYRVAPSWLLRMPWLWTEDQQDGLLRQTAGTGAERPLREYEMLCRRFASSRTLVIWLEDLHVADPESFELFRHLAVGTAAMPMMIVATCRVPDVGGEQQALRTLLQGLREECLLTEIALAHLDLDDIVAYLSNRAPGAVVADALAPSLLATTGGNPLFLKTIVDDWIAGSPPSLTTTGGLSEGSGPPETLRRLLESQFSQLPVAAQDILSFAAVLGREFSPRLTARVVGRPRKLVAGKLSELSANTPFIRFERQEASSDGGRPLYRLAHDLYRLILYGRLSASRRKSMHRKIAESLSREGTDWGPRRPADASRHFRLAGQTVEAFRWIRQAIEESLARNLPREALALLPEGESLLSEIEARHPAGGNDGSSDEIAFHLLAGTVFSVTLGFGDSRAKENFSKALKLSQKLGFGQSEFQAVSGLWTAHFMRGDLNEAHKLSRRLDAMAQQSDDDEIRLFALLSRIGYSVHGGRFADGMDCSRSIKQIYDSQRFGHHAFRFGVDVGIFGHGSGAWIETIQGYHHAAARDLEQGLKLADALGYPIAQAINRTFATICHQLRGDAQAVLATADSALEVTREYDFTQWTMITTLTRCWALAVTGDPAHAITGLREGIEAWRKLGFGLDQPRFLAMLADAELMAGRPENAIRTCHEALEIAERSGERWQDGECHRLLAIAEAKRNRGSKMRLRAHFETAVRLARAQDAGLWELRALLDWLAHTSNTKDEDSLRTDIAAVADRIRTRAGSSDVAELRRASAVVSET